MASMWAVGFYILAALSGVSVGIKSHHCCVLERASSVLVCYALVDGFVGGRAVSASATTSVSRPSSLDNSILQNSFKALADLQNSYFNKTQNTWPNAIDWTAAVVQTIVSGTMSTLTQSLDAATVGNDWKQKESLLSYLHEQIVSSYFGQQVDKILDEAYDDVLWVVLGWVEAINFVRLHQDLHYPNSGFGDKSIPTDLRQALQTMPWHGQFWVDVFAQRANKFWNFSTQGWDTKFCHGGMTWNPRLETYKNAITNELYISGSIAMYLYYPGDGWNGMTSRNDRYLQAAKDGYNWLTHINMTNDQGLFVDGFHINHKIAGNVECDERNEMVYTYNQGVILTGNRDLFTATGDASYVHDGHKYIKAVIAATGWNLQRGQPVDSLSKGHLPPWRGLGRYGIMEEECDASATCSQDSQIFKGIYFHHLTAFCQPLELVDGVGKEEEKLQVRQAHASSCRRYVDWVKHNADAALQTRDGNGHFGMWWGAKLFSIDPPRSDDGINHFSANTTDYRNEGTPHNQRWGGQDVFVLGGGNATAEAAASSNSNWAWGDPNNRGRGRTVETQAGGLALLRAYWAISKSV